MKKYYIFGLVVLFALAACNKNEINQLPVQKALKIDFIKQPYTYLQTKYIDLTLAYEFKKQGQAYKPDKLSFDQKLELINLLDSTRIDDENDIKFYQTLEGQLISEINSHPYLQNFVKRFASKFYDPNDMIIDMGLGDTDNLSKYLILYCYETGFDVYGKCLERETLTGEEEWNLSLPLPPYPKGMEVEDGEPSNSPPIQKAVRYTLSTRWGKTIEYMFKSDNVPISIRDSVTKYMKVWAAAANNKIQFKEITKDIGWNQFLWCIGCKYFIRVREEYLAGNDGTSSVGNMPYAFLRLIKYPSQRTCLHELGHTLGLFHEHQRPDRDDYVTYYFNNVKSDQIGNFTKMPAGSYNYYGSTFDFESIMIYYSWAYAKNGYTGKTADATMLKKNGTDFWYNTKLSATDKSVIKQIYNY